ncbi:hypothetical protein ACQ4PT_036925 [Festuca glaucescens]
MARGRRRAVAVHPGGGGRGRGGTFVGQRRPRRRPAWDVQNDCRHSPRKADFLEYIAYLLRVDALRDLRKRAIIRATPDPNHKDDGKKRKRKKSKWAKSVSDFAGVTRVLDVYHLATIRFKGDLDLWFRYLEFCRHKRHGRMKEVKITEDLAVNVARSLRYEINRAFASLRGLVKAVT